MASLPPNIRMQEKLDAIAKRKALIESQLTALRKNSKSAEPVQTQLLVANATFPHTLPSDDTDREFFSSGYLAIDAARQNIISASSQRAPPPPLIPPSQSHIPTGGPDPLERARLALGRSTSVQAESTQITLARDVLRARLSDESSELTDVEARLAAASAQLMATREELLAKTNEVECLRGQLSELMAISSELLRVVDPEWHELKGSRTAVHPISSSITPPLHDDSLVTHKHPQFWDSATQSASTFLSPAPTASSYDGLLVRMDKWAARQESSSFTAT